MLSSFTVSTGEEFFAELSGNLNHRVVRVDDSSREIDFELILKGALNQPRS